MKKYGIILSLLMSITILMGCTSSNNSKANCNHNYISEEINVFDDRATLGITEALYYRENDEISSGYENAYVAFKAVTTKNGNENKDENSPIGYKDIKITAISETSYGESETKLDVYSGKAGAVSTDLLYIHKDNNNHIEQIITAPVVLDFDLYTKFIITFVEFSYFESVERVIEIPIDKVKCETDYNKLKETQFNSYYKVIDKSYSSDEVFSIKLNSIKLEGNDFVGNFDIKNVSKEDLNNLDIYINPIRQNGFGYIGYTEPKFDRENGYLSLKSGESKTLNFKINIDEYIDNLYYSDIDLFPLNPIKDNEEFIAIIGVKSMNNDSNMVFPDTSNGRLMYYFKENIKVSKKEMTEEEKENLENDFTEDLKESDEYLEEYDFDNALKVISKYGNEEYEIYDLYKVQVEKIEQAKKDYEDEVSGNNEFNIFNPNRKLTEEEAIQLAKYRVNFDEPRENGILEEVIDGRECLKIYYFDHKDAMRMIMVDLNTGYVDIDFGLGWERYTKVLDELKIGTAYGWESVK